MKYAILSDIHANVDALRAVLAHIDEAHGDIPIWFLGDAVGYYPDFREVLECLVYLQQTHRLHVWMKGNHDAAVHDPAIHHQMGSVARTAIHLTIEQMSPKQKQLLAAQPEQPQVVADPQDRHITVSHASPDDPLWGYMDNQLVARHAAAHLATSLCLLGHTHVPRKIFQNDRNRWVVQELFHVKDNNDTFTYQDEGRPVFLNPGSVGRPLDGYPQVHAAYALLDTANQTFRVYRVQYATEAIRERTRQWLAEQALTPEEFEQLLTPLNGQ